MITEKERLVINFIKECRDETMIKDELFEKSEKLYETMFNLEKEIENSPRAKALYVEIENLIYETLRLTEDKYFQYGQNFMKASSNTNYQLEKQLQEAV